MFIVRRNRRLSAATLFVGTLGGAALTAAFPAIATGAGAAVTTVTCSVTGANWCISGNNTSSGVGVIGTSKSGTGLRGTSTSQYGLKATSGSSYAILAQSTSGAAAISASTTNGYGVYGLSTGAGIGLYGSSAVAYGVFGTTASGHGAGIVGEESGSGTGVYGSSSSGAGVVASTTSGTALSSYASGSGIGASITSNAGSGLLVNSAGDTAVYAHNSNGIAGDFSGTYAGLYGRAPSGGFPFVATDSTGNTLFYVNGAGDIAYKGSLFHITALGRGHSVKSFTPDATEPTVEDMGSARLVNGTAAVRLDRTFAGVIEAGRGYRVFVTPNGDTRGLFVATKTPAGFIVREAQGGRSGVEFDYRIVATALGRAGQRMGLESNVFGTGSGPREAMSIERAVRVPTRIKPAPALPAAQ